MGEETKRQRIGLARPKYVTSIEFKSSYIINSENSSRFQAMPENEATTNEAISP